MSGQPGPWPSAGVATHAEKLACSLSGWLPHMDSNHDKMIQNHLCYRYTMRQLRLLEDLQPFHSGFPQNSLLQIR